MGPSEWAAVVAIAVVVLLLVGLSGLFIVTLRRGEASDKKTEEEPAGRDRPRGRSSGSGSSSRLRNRLRQRRRHQVENDDEGLPEEPGEEEEELSEEDDPAPAATRNERVAQRRQADRDARAEAREAERARWEAKQEKRSAYEERRRQREAEREERERQEEEEKLRALEERRKKDEEDAAKWAEFITVEKTGEKQGQEEEGILKRFVDTIREQKTVVLEDLAAEFQMRTQEVIQRVQDLEKMGRITGVMDDRGKFIYISMEEMENVANFIKSRGRVAISELARRSNGFIDLESKAPKATQTIDLDLGDLDEVPEMVDVAA